MDKVYTIFYEYYDKRGYRRDKKVICCGLEKLREKCIEIASSTDKKPIVPPTILETLGIDIYGNSIDFDDVIGGKLDEKNI